MKRILTLFFCASIVSFAAAQDEMIIEAGEPGILEQTILGDTLPTGERANPNRTYVLRRGTPYVLAQALSFSGFDLKIAAEEGEGARPLIVFGPGDGGDGLSQVVVIGSDASLYMKGIHLTARDLLGNVAQRALRANGDGDKITIDQCVVTDVGQSIIRMNSDSQTVVFKNSIFNRIGQPENPNNGRLIDTRGNYVDTAWVENCVVYATTSRYYRPDDGKANVINFNQNTFWGSGQWGFTFGEANELSITNNVIAESVFLGQTDSMPRYVITMDTFISGTHNVNVSYNNIFTSTAFEDALPADRLGDSLYSVRNSMFGPQIANAIMESASATTNISEELAFADAPNIPTQFMEADAADTSTSSRIVEEAGSWDFSDLTPNDVYSALGTAGDRYSDYHDFSYPETAQSATAGSEGQKLGADLTNLGTDVKEDFFVSENILYYPNPVQEELFIQNLDKAKLRAVHLYNVVGHRIRFQPVNGINVRLQLGDLPQGTYILTIEDANNKVSSRKIVKH